MQDQRSRIRVYDLFRDVPEQIQELVIPEPTSIALTSNGSGWVASTPRGLIWVSLRDASTAMIQLYPTGIVTHWNDGVVDISAGARSWIMCHSGTFALPAESCAEQRSARERHRPRSLW
jgi:hypothetical protein